MNSNQNTILFWRLDRLGRSVRHLLDLAEDLRNRGLGFKSICDGAIDTTTASGELVFHISSARARGRMGGRKRMVVEDPRIPTTKKLHGDKSMPVVTIYMTLKISRPTL